jgi:omega-6 fatty acid desaturase / acyl-lipid omega-6 desaturase (Delta-12 desaturase)
MLIFSEQVEEKKPLFDTYGREFQLPDFTMNDILEAIPAECFNREVVKGFSYVARDFLLIGLLGLTAHYGIPLLPSSALRFTAWCVYGFVQGLVGTGVWVLAHECGHQAFSPSRKLNDIVGWILHSFLLVPYFSWQITHGKHHKATGHLSKDMVFVPSTRAGAIARRGGDPSEFPDTEELSEELENKLYDLIEEAPLVSLIRLFLQQSLGWLGYIALNLTGQKYPGTHKLRINHFNPSSPFFSQQDYNKILLSDLGILITFTGLFLASKTWGFSTVFRFYVVPYFWVNHWLVLITYLQHTDPAIPHYRAGAWNFQRGAAATMDRDFGFIGKHLFHDIIEVPPIFPLYADLDSCCSSFLFAYSVL